MSDRNPSAVQARIKELNLATAELSAAGMFQMVEQLLTDAATTQDPELRRKIADTVHKFGVSMEPKATVTVWAPLNFSIVTDRTVSQVAPPKKSSAKVPLVEEIEDATPVQEALPLLPEFTAHPDDDPLGLADLANMLEGD